MTPFRRGIRFAQFGLVSIGIAALGYSLWYRVSAKVFEDREARAFAFRMRPRLALPPPPRALDDGVVGKLEIPRLSLSVMVVDGVSDSDLRRAAGHIPGTALPDRPGNVGIAAHRDTFFRPLQFVRPGDAVILTTLVGRYEYRVLSTNVVRPDDIQVLYPAERDLLTLVTCYPFDWLGSAPRRFIVRAERSPALTARWPRGGAR